MLFATALSPTSAWSKLSLSDTAGLKGVFDDLNPALQCVERFSLASAYVLKHYDIKTGLYQAPSELRADSPAISKLISMMFHRVGEETPQLTKLEPVASLVESDLLALLRIISQVGPQQKKIKELCLMFENTVGSLSRDSSGGIAGEFVLSSGSRSQEVLAFIDRCRAALYPEPATTGSSGGISLITPSSTSTAPFPSPSLSPFHSPAVLTTTAAAPLSAGPWSTITLSGMACSVPILRTLLGPGICGDPLLDPVRMSGAIDPEEPRLTLQFEFIKKDQVRDLIQTRTRLKELRATGGTISQNLLKAESYLYQKLEQQFLFLSLIAQSLEHTLTPRVLGAIYLQKSSRNQADLSKDSLALYVASIHDSCLSPAGVLLKKEIEKIRRAEALSSVEEARVQAFKIARYLLPPSPISASSIEGLRDFGEKVFVWEQMGLESSPAPRRLIYRSANSRKESSEVNYADCAETGVFNIIQSVFAQDNNLEMDLALLRSKSRVLADWYESKGLTRVLDQETYDESFRDQWNMFLNHLNQSAPLHLLTNRERGGKKYEIQADLGNLFKLMKHLFPGCAALRDLAPIHHASIPLAMSGREDQAARSGMVVENFRILSSCLSRDSRTVEFSTSYLLSWDDASFKSEHAQIVLQMNGKKALEMNMGAHFILDLARWTRVGHFGIKDNIDIPAFWSFSGL